LRFTYVKWKYIQKAYFQKTSEKSAIATPSETALDGSQ